MVSAVSTAHTESEHYVAACSTHKNFVGFQLGTSVCCMRQDNVELHVCVLEFEIAETASLCILTMRDAEKKILRFLDLLFLA